MLQGVVLNTPAGGRNPMETKSAVEKRVVAVGRQGSMRSKQTLAVDVGGGGVVCEREHARRNSAKAK